MPQDSNHPDPTFGIMTAPMQTDYEALRQVWLEADAIEAIDHAWLFDHFLPIAGELTGPIFEGWTLLSALAAQTTRLRVGIMVTSNRFRPPAILAKIATTVDIVSGGRLDFGIGAGSRPSVPFARREYEAHGLPYADFSDSVGSLAEALDIIRRLWTEDGTFDVDGRHHHLVGAIGNPKPVQRPHPPIVIGGRSTPTLRVVAEYADVWNTPGDDLAEAVRRSAQLDEVCATIGRDPSTITRSVVLPVAVEHPADTRESVSATIAAGFSHVVLALPAPYEPGIARWVADEVIEPSVSR